MSYRAALNIEDLHKIAKRRLPRVAYEFLAGGVEDDVSLANNRAVFERIRFRPHTLVNVAERSQEVSVYGRTFKCPFGIAPTGAAGLYGFAADIALARAADAIDILRTEVDRVMAMLGCPSISDLTVDCLACGDPDLLRRTPASEGADAKRVRAI